MDDPRPQLINVEIDLTVGFRRRWNLAEHNLVLNRHRILHTKLFTKVELRLATSGARSSLCRLARHQKLHWLLLLIYCCCLLRVEHLAGGDQLLLLSVIQLLHLLWADPLAHGSGLLLLLVHQVNLHLLLLLHLQIRLLLSSRGHRFGTLWAHPSILGHHLVLNLLGLETVVLVLHDNAAGWLLVGILDLSCIGTILHDNMLLLVEVLLVLTLRLPVFIILVVRLVILVIVIHLVVLQLVIFWLRFIVLHVDHFVAAVIFVLVLIVLGHHVLEVGVLILIHFIYNASFLSVYQVSSVLARDISGFGSL